MKYLIALFGLSATLGFTSVAMPAVSEAQPAPGCGFVSQLPWSPCAKRPPVVGVTPGWTPVYGVPGTIGPNGYNPIRGNY